MLFVLPVLSVQSVISRAVQRQLNEMKYNLIQNDTNISRSRTALGLIDPSRRRPDKSDEIDGIAFVKVGNLSGYEINFPDGTMKFASEIPSLIVCNGAFQTSPLKRKTKEFHVGGFIGVVSLGLVFCIVVTAIWPTVFLLKGNIDMIKKMLLTLIKEEDRPKLHSRDKLEIFAYVWVGVGAVCTLIFSIFTANVLLTLSGLSNMYRITSPDKCYALDVSNITQFSKSRSLSSNDNIPPAISRGQLITSDNGTMFIQTNCDSALVEVGTDHKYQIVYNWHEHCASRMGKRFINGQTAIALGCPGGAGQWYQKKPEWANGEIQYECNKQACGCSSPCFTCNQWKCMSVFYKVDEEEWEDCTYTESGSVRVYRDGQDVTDELVDFTTAEDGKRGWVNGYLQKDSMVVIKDSTYSNGAYSNLYTGTLSTEDWIKKYLVNGYDSATASLSQPRNVSVRPTRTQCRLMIKFKNELPKKFTELTKYCHFVKAEIQENGVVTLSTIEKQTCNVPVKVVNDTAGHANEATVSISESNPVTYFGITAWKCKTIKGEGKGVDCDYNNPYEDFKAESVESEYGSFILEPSVADPPPSESIFDGFSLSGVKGLLDKSTIWDTIIGAIIVIIVVPAVAFVGYWAIKLGAKCFPKINRALKNAVNKVGDESDHSSTEKMCLV